MYSTAHRIKIKYQNIQAWNEDRRVALVAQLTENDPDVILMAAVGKTTQHKIKILNYNVFVSNKNNENHAGCGIAIKKGIKFELKNNFKTDWIGATIETINGPLLITTAYVPPRIKTINPEDLRRIETSHIPTIWAGDPNARHQTFGYSNANHKGHQLSQRIGQNKINYIGPVFNTYYTRVAETKPDVILTNNTFHHNYLIEPGTQGVSDHTSINITI